MVSIQTLIFVMVFGTIYVNSLENNRHKWPTVVISILARNKEHTLPYFLTLLSRMDYPKDRISLWIRSDHNSDKTIDVLKMWLNKESKSYHRVYHELDDSSNFLPLNDDIGDWTDSRFLHVSSLREMAIEYAKNAWADYIFMIDADVFLTDPYTLNNLVLKELDVVAPMLNSDGLYSNFWCGMTSNYYYERTDDYKNILDRVNTGCFEVPMVHTAVLINLRQILSDQLTYDPRKVPNYKGPLDDIIAFAISANKSGIPMNICNDKRYGFIMVPLEKGNTLENDHLQLINLKVESIYDEYLIESDSIFDDFIDVPKADKMGYDEVYLINLERRTDRKEKMDLCFKELGLHIKNIVAVDGRTLSDETLPKWGVKVMPNYLDPYHKRPMTFGEIGCFLSHYVVWKDIVDSNHQYVMVLEDDLHFESYFRNKLEVLMKEIDEYNIDWDLIYLGRKRLVSNETQISPSLVEAGYSYWTLAYLLSNRGAKKLLDAEPLANLLPVDEYLPIMSDMHPREEWSEHFKKRDLIVLSAEPLLIYPTHYTGENGYVSDTENSVQITTIMPPGQDREDL